MVATAGSQAFLDESRRQGRVFAIEEPRHHRARQLFRRIAQARDKTMIDIKQEKRAPEAKIGTFYAL